MIIYKKNSHHDVNNYLGFQFLHVTQLRQQGGGIHVGAGFYFVFVGAGRNPCTVPRGCGIPFVFVFHSGLYLVPSHQQSCFAQYFTLYDYSTDAISSTYFCNSNVYLQPDQEKN